jgi:hypothetical protein
MVEEWIVRVQGKEYGPADLETLRQWKSEGRVLSTNEARRVDVDLWTSAAEIPELFEVAPSGAEAVAAATAESTHDSSLARRSFGQIIGETLRIYREGFFRFVALALLAVLPWLCGQLVTSWIETAPNVNVDLRTLVAGGFAFCMLVLTMALWPIYIAAIQILTAEIAAGRRIRFLAALNEAVKYWPRVAALCLVVYGIFFLLIIFAAAIAAIALAGGSSLFAPVLALGLLMLQVWMFSRFFINVLFWQQFAVLENAGVTDSLRLSKELARSGHHLPWFRRPMWRGAFIASLWFAFVLAIALVQEWPALRHYFTELMTVQDPQALLQKLNATSQAHVIDAASLGLSLLQRILQPSVGIAFVVLYLDSKSSKDA